MPTAPPCPQTGAGVSKYHAKKVRDGGHVFDSMAEHRHWQDLCLLESQGMLTKLEVHPKFELIVNDVKIGRYTADFSYLDENDIYTVVDVKGVRTRDYVMRKKLMLALHGIEIKEVEA